MTKRKNRQQPKQDDFPYWKCECGNQDICRDTDQRVSLGEYVFRRNPPCPTCKRPMQLGQNKSELQPV